MPPKERVSLPVNLGFVAAARQFNSFLFRTPKPLVPIGKNLVKYSSKPVCVS